ncbi:MAG: BatA domain-containing protein [Planctomycetota bacterium]
MFLNSIAMIALTAVVVPVVVHLHRRRESKVVDWAAMQFLSHSLVNRRRGMTLEHLLLLLCRCLLVALFVLAMARPQINSATDLRWIFASLLGLSGLVALAWSAVNNNGLWVRLAAFAVAFALIATAALLTTLGKQGLPRRNQPRDVAIVIDASSSMKLEVDGTSNFRRATEEARWLVDSLPGGSTVTMQVAGPVIASSTIAQKNLRKVANELSLLDVMGGGTDLGRAIEHSRIALDKGPNSQKQIVVFSDGQLRPWRRLADSSGNDWHAKNSDDSVNQQDPNVESNVTGESDDSIKIFCRTLPMPSEVKDVAVIGLAVDSRTLSLHRPVTVVAELLNAGSADVADLQLELLVNDEVLQVESVRELAISERTRVTFEHTFDQSGWNTVSARLKSKDDLPDNDIFHHVVHVASNLPVLIVNGESTIQTYQRPATFLQLSLDPDSLEQPEGVGNQTSQLIRVDTVDAAEIPRVTSFSDYQVIVLCDVARLPSDISERLGTFVEQGGGLWVIPGERCQQNFYNGWSSQSTGNRLLPMKLIERSDRDPNERTKLGLDFESVFHVTLEPLLKTGQHDLFEFQVLKHWRLGSWANDQPTNIVARLTNGDPLLVEHSIGRGRVLLTSISLHRLESNLISRVSFPVLTHLLVEHLADINSIDLNHQPHRDLLVQLKASDLPTDQPLSLRTPDGAKRTIRKINSREDGQLSIEVGQASKPGLYQLSDPTQGMTTVVPFTVLCDKDEFDLTAASESKLEELGQNLSIKWINKADEIESIARGTSETIELWNYLVVGALIMIVIETAVLRWIAFRRRASGTVKSVPSPVALPWRAQSLQDAGGAPERRRESRRSHASQQPLVEVFK